MNEPLPSGIYRHYSGLLCQVLGIGEHTETKEVLVIYLTLGVKAGYKLRARPYTMFQSSATVGGKTVPRFTYLGDTIPVKEEKIARDPLGQYSDFEK